MLICILLACTMSVTLLQGNSWMHKRCDWRRRLLDVVGIHINVPQLTNKYLPCQQQQHQKPALPCPSVGGLIAHHKWVGEFFQADPQGAHMCEYSFFVDKIKDEVGNSLPLLLS